jgi:coiled-coil domain-containing protein 130
MHWSDDVREDDYTLNEALRRTARADRKEAAAAVLEAEQKGLSIALLPATAEDAAAAAALELDLVR